MVPKRNLTLSVLLKKQFNIYVKMRTVLQTLVTWRVEREILRKLNDSPDEVSSFFVQEEY